MEQNAIKTDLMVVGAGISGMTAALEAAEAGFRVVLIEKNPYVGGRVAQLNQYFPKLCPPSCGLEINIRRLRENSNITLYTMAEIESVENQNGSHSVKIKVKPRYIKDDCLNTDEHVNEIAIERKNDFNFNLDNSKVIYRPYSNSYPQHYVLDKDACTTDELRYLAGNCKGLIDLDQQEEYITFHTKSIIWATGWVPYDATKIETLSYSKYPEVITNVEMERLASLLGPTAGNIVVPSSGTQPQKVVFVQCAGSRDENHLEFCSSVCCLAALKQAQYIREQIPSCEIHIFYIDIRATGIFEDFYTKSKKDEKLFLHRGKVARVFKESGSNRLTVEAEDTLAGSLNQLDADLVVLSTGMKPDTSKIDKSLLDRNGFFRTDTDTGQYGCGVCTRPKDVASSVQESTGAAMKAIINIKRSK